LNKKVILNNEFVLISDLIQKEITAAGIMYNKFIVNAHEVIDDPTADYL